MIAAIYARKSTEQHVADEAKSVTRQVDNARAFALARGWTVPDEHVYVDDGISGAEFERRPGFQRMLALLPDPPFSILIVSEQKSIGREASETAYTIKRLAEAGVEIFEYTHGRSLIPRNAIDKVVSGIQGFADEAHREATAARVHEAHVRLHKAGKVVGGRVFGYKNVDVFKGVDAHGRPLRSHVERVIDPTEAAIVVQIFKLYDSGLGIKRIAKRLNADGAPAPKYGRRVDGLTQIGVWSQSTVCAVLGRETYRGIVIWGKTKKRNSWGKLDTTDRPASEWHRVAVPHLRIIDDSLWKRVQSRRHDVEGKTVRFASGRLSGRPRKDAVQNLLAGIATCGVCGGGLVVERSNNKKGQYAYYICHRHRALGTCTNTLRVSVDDMNEAVLAAIETHALTPEAIEQVVRLTERDEVAEQRAMLERERKDIQKRIAVVTDVLTQGHADVASLVSKLRELEARALAISADLVALRPVPRLAPAVIDDRLSEWRRLLRSSVTQGRMVLQRVLRGRITFTPRTHPIGGELDGYTFEAATRFDRLFTGLAVQRPAWLTGSGTGAEDIGPEDTPEADYGRLLEAVEARIYKSEKGWRALQDSNLRPPGS